ncbi:hypothetical protein E2C01_092744 [Portunus trituberculatus]|uniref:Uncharacterized protein n=1 Tax=Portunus trituberculatus TaxID=210409 RepID=A0A5B7JRE9_PORTR|nr:hypothetical protein [Portunus trituberculatus]
MLAYQVLFIITVKKNIHENQPLKITINLKRFENTAHFPAGFKSSQTVEDARQAVLCPSTLQASTGGMIPPMTWIHTVTYLELLLGASASAERCAVLSGECRRPRVVIPGTAVWALLALCPARTRRLGA